MNVGQLKGGFIAAVELPAVEKTALARSNRRNPSPGSPPRADTIYHQQITPEMTLSPKVDCDLLILLVHINFLISSGTIIIIFVFGLVIFVTLICYTFASIWNECSQMKCRLYQIITVSLVAAKCCGGDVLCNGQSHLSFFGGHDAK